MDVGDWWGHRLFAVHQGRLADNVIVKVGSRW
jgi:hypothetical protein